MTLSVFLKKIKRQYKARLPKLIITQNEFEELVFCIEWKDKENLRYYYVKSFSPDTIKITGQEVCLQSFMEEVLQRRNIVRRWGN